MSRFPRENWQGTTAFHPAGFVMHLGTEENLETCKGMQKHSVELHTLQADCQAHDGIVTGLQHPSAICVDLVRKFEWLNGG